MMFFMDLKAGTSPVPGEGDSVVLWALGVQLDGGLRPGIYPPQARLLQAPLLTPHPSHSGLTMYQVDHPLPFRPPAGGSPKRVTQMLSHSRELWQNRL